MDQGRVRLLQNETFTGLLVPLLWGSMEKPTTRGFEQMNAALKTISEAGGRAAAG